MEKNKNKIVAPILLLLMAIPNFAQKITIQEAAEMAVKNNKDIKVGMLEMDREQIDVSRTWKQRFFTVSYNASANAYFKNVMSKKTGEAYQQYLSLSQPLFTGGTIMAGVMGARAYENIASYNYLQSKNQNRLDTIKIYSNIINAEKDMQVLEKSFKILK